MKEVKNKKDSNEKIEKIKEKKNKYSILFIFIGIFLFGIVFINLSFSFQLKGDKLVRIPYHTTYQENGANVKIFAQDFSKHVSIKGTVDTNKVGKYTLKYSYQLGFFPVVRTREVEVVDEEKPIIELKGQPSKNICPNKDYEEEGYTAVDDYDGDITDKVEVIREEGSIKYKVADSSGNVAVVEREIKKVDEEGPKIRLSSGSKVYVKRNSTYKEYGYTAVDNCDGDITDKVTVEGSVDTSQVGTYELKYKVEDSAGNKTEVIRQVVVNEVKVSQSTGKPGVIYLTFDDGPSSSGSTEKILNVLKEEGVKATFFVTRSGPDSLIKREFDEGHTVALHTYTHDYKQVYSSVDGFFDDLTKIQNRVKNITGQTPYVTRFPGGSNNTISNKYNKGIMQTLKTEVMNRGFVYFDWNVDASDAWACARKNVSDKKTCVYNNVIRNLSKQRANVVLMHDIKSYTADALRDIIQYGKNNGYVFEVLTKDTAQIKFN